MVCNKRLVKEQQTSAKYCYKPVGDVARRRDFDSITIDRELGYAERSGFNVMRSVFYIMLHGRLIMKGFKAKNRTHIFQLLINITSVQCLLCLMIAGAIIYHAGTQPAPK